MAAVLTWEPLRQRLDWLQFQARAERTLAISCVPELWKDRSQLLNKRIEELRKEVISYIWLFSLIS